MGMWAFTKSILTHTAWDTTALLGIACETSLPLFVSSIWRRETAVCHPGIKYPRPAQYHFPNAKDSADVSMLQVNSSLVP
jgi:hypothetical protein